MRSFAGASSKDVWFGVAAILTAVISWRPLVELFGRALNHEQYSHTLLVLPIVLTLMVIEREASISSAFLDWVVGGLLVVLAGMLSWIAMGNAKTMDATSHLSMSILGLVLAWIGLAILFYGTNVYRRHLFLCVFLFFLVPIPDALLAHIISFLQDASTRVSEILFRLTRIPVSRHGFILSLPTIDIEVAAECSGIRSTMILILVSLTLGHLFLRSAYHQLILLCSTLFLAILKNAVRIFTLAVLAIYVDPSWLQGEFHHRYGGSIFFASALLLVFGLLELLVRLEHARSVLTDRKPEHAAVS